MSIREQYKKAYSMVRTMRGNSPVNVNPVVYAAIRSDILGEAFKHLLNSHARDPLQWRFVARNPHVGIRGGKYVYNAKADGIPF